MTFNDILNYLDTIINFTIFELNQTPVSLASIIMFIVVMIAFLLFSKFLNRVILNRILKRFQIEESKSYTMMRINHYFIIIVGAIVAFQFIGIDLSGLAVIFGLLSVGIGFGLQNITSNFIAGLILLFEQPIKIGDRVLVGETEGDVTDISIRSTTIRSLNNVSIIVPNSDFISSNVVNWSHGDTRIRLDIKVGVSYNSDLDTVLKSLHEVAEENTKVIKHPKPDILLREFGDSSWNMVLRVWIDDPKGHHVVRSDLNCAIVRKFRKYNVEIPFPQRDLHIKGNDSVDRNLEVRSKK